MIIAVNSEPSETGEHRETSEAMYSCNYSYVSGESDPDLTCFGTVEKMLVALLSDKLASLEATLVQNYDLPCD